MTPKQKANKLYNDFAYDFVRCNVENASQKAKDAAIRQKMQPLGVLMKLYQHNG